MGRSSNEKYILGAGLVGLTAAHYLPDHTVISTPPHIPSLSEGPFYLHSSSLSSKLLSELGLPADTKTIRFGFLSKGKIRQPTEELIVSYHKAVYGSDPCNGYIRRHLTGEHLVHETTMEELYLALHEETKDRILGQEVRKVNLKDRTLVTTGGKYTFKNLVSTIPAPVLGRITGVDMDLVHRPIYVALTASENFSQDIYDTPYDYAYLSDCMCNRITKWIRPWVVVESNLPLNIPGAKEFPYGKIVTAYQHDDGIHRVGRWAVWKNGYMFNDALEDIEALR
jgi:hypothetical protein